MPRFGVTPAKEQALLERMAANAVREEDLDESFIRSSGPGGQHVNKTATCVYLKHRPTGLEVKAQESRSQALNRYHARKRLCELIEEQDPEKKSAAQLKREKLKKQKARRRKRAKQKVNENPDPADE